MASKNTIRAVEYTNNIGQTIKPGDEVVIITSGYNHRVNTNKGIYLGLNGKENGCACRVTEQHTRYRFKETGEDVGHSWYTHAKNRNENLNPPRMEYGHRYGTPEYTAASEKYKSEYAEYNERVKNISEQYEAFKVPYYRQTTLQLNRIYKVDTTVADAAKL